MLPRKFDEYLDDGDLDEFAEDMEKLRLMKERVQRKLAGGDDEDHLENEEIRKICVNTIADADTIDKLMVAIENDDCDQITKILTKFDPTSVVDEIIVCAIREYIEPTTMKVLLDDDRIDGAIDNNLLIRTYFEDEDIDMLKVLYANERIKNKLNEDMQSQIEKMIFFKNI